MSPARRSPSFAFWLDYLDSRGGLWEQSGDTVLAMLPDQLAAVHDLPESTLITDDPDIAREDGVLFLGAGHPEIDRAAKSIVDEGDVAAVALGHWGKPVSTKDVLARVRDQVPVDHGRIDATAAPLRTHRATLRLGALVSHTVSAEETFTEVAECLIDMASRIAWPEDAAARLRQAAAAAEGTPGRQPRATDLVPALAAANQVLDEAATARGQALAAGADAERAEEIARATDYYAAALAAIDKRHTDADPDRAALLDARTQATLAERDRRLAEITEKYQHNHALRPYRLQLIDLPAWRLATNVRRGERRWPVTFDYLPLLGTVAPTRCPNCQAHAPLVAAKTHLGCAACLPPAPVTPSAPTTQPASPRPHRTPSPTTGRDRRPPSAERPQRIPASARSPVVGPTRPVLPGKAEERKVINFWNHVGAGDHRKLVRQVAADSPLSALVRLYGAAGPLHGIGVPAGDTPTGFTCGNYDRPVAGDRGGTAGTVRTHRDEYPYLLLWSADRLLEEILPYSAPWHLGRSTGFHRPPTLAPAPRIGLDPVATLLLTRTTAHHGLTYTARALAAWWRLPNAEDLLIRFDPAILAAALDRAIRYWSGAPQATYPDVAKAFRADESAIRKATPTLQKQLQLNTTRNW
ncbi:MAG TPA: hypothetical protein VGG05_23355 [Pseudonocardiaceae bacterium]